MSTNTLINIAITPQKLIILIGSRKRVKPKIAAPRGSPRLRVAALAVSQFLSPAMTRQ